VFSFAHIPSVVNHTINATPPESCNNIPPFYNEPHLSHVLCVKPELRTTLTSWSQHHFLAIGKTQSAYAQSFTLWQQATIEFTCHDHSIIACSCHVHSAFLRGHLVRGESHNQHNATGELQQLQAHFLQQCYLDQWWGTCCMGQTWSVRTFHMAWIRIFIT